MSNEPQVVLPARTVSNRWRSFGFYVRGAARKDADLAIQASGLNWTAHKVPLTYEWKNERRTQVGQYSVVRDDTGDTVGTVGDQFTVYQNADQVRFFENLVQSGHAEYDTIGCLKGGSLTWVLASLNNMSKEVVEGDQVGMNMLFANAHDGSLKVNLGYTPIRVVCQNTLKLAIRSNASQLFKLKHKEGIYVAVAAIKDIMEQVHELFEMNIEQYQKLARSGVVSQKDLEKIVLKTVLKKDPDEDQDLAKRTENNLQAIMDAIKFSPGSDKAPGSLWSAYNGINWWLFNDAPTRRRKDGTSGDDNDSILHSGWFGQNAKKEENLLSEMLALVA